MENSLNLNSGTLIGFLKYRDMRDNYFKNAEKFANTNILKASEFLWGAAALAIKALAALNQKVLLKHNEITQFVYEFSKEKKEPNIKRLYWDMNKLHSNFYEGTIPDYDFEEYFSLTKQFLKKIANYYPPEDNLKLMNTTG